MEEFDKYISKFDMNESLNLLKYNHSYRVSNLSKMLAESLGLNSDDVKLATIIGLLHDIGRFEQIKKFNTLKDINTMDHGDYGAYLLFEEGLISRFTDDKKNYEIIKACVKEHNKYEISKELDERTLLFVKIIRDADKLDIYNYLTNLNQSEFECEGEISKEVKEIFYSNKAIDNKVKKTKADWAIGILTFIYDINFNESFKYVNEEKFVSKLLNRVNNKDKYKEYFEHVEKYIQNKLEEK